MVHGCTWCTVEGAVLSRRRKPVAEDGSDSLESSQSCVDLSDLAIVVSSWEDALELLGCAAFTAAAAAALILLGNVIVAEASTSPSAFVQNVIYSTRLPSSPIPIAQTGKGEVGRQSQTLTQKQLLITFMWYNKISGQSFTISVGDKDNTSSSFKFNFNSHASGWEILAPTHLASLAPCSACSNCWCGCFSVVGKAGYGSRQCKATTIFSLADFLKLIVFFNCGIKHLLLPSENTTQVVECFNFHALNLVIPSTSLAPTSD
ncbi:uncharacterized protein LOC110763354 [Prunus avium]|uniref:Uncharacterized protein LOC110763354 n=1 Tax=Prunus avium TaxID=42229 RepID=A0A6P5SYD2_PRUAV|nr:uncharacterized protein LOC110763354 [Prunus avium]